MLKPDTGRVWLSRMRKCGLLTSRGKKINRHMLSLKGSACSQPRKDNMHERKAPGWTKPLDDGRLLEMEPNIREQTRARRQRRSSQASSQVFHLFGGLESLSEASVPLKHVLARARCSNSELRLKENPWISRVSLILMRTTAPQAPRNRTPRAPTKTEAATSCPSQQA